MLFLHRIKLGQTRKKVEEHSVPSLDSEDASRDVAYLQAGLDIKYARVKGVKWFFIMVFPVYLLALQQFLDGILATYYSPWILPLLFVLSYVIWSLFFRSDINRIDEIKARVNYLEGRAKAIAKS